MSQVERAAGPAPSVGRIVHYVARGSADGVFKSACRVAIITEIGALTPAAAKIGGEASVGLCVMNPTGLFFRAISDDENGSSAHDEDGKLGGTWHWPERV